MKLITWNTQWCRGIDKRVDPARIVKHARAIADFDVLCLQEIANNFPDPRLPGSRGENQFAELSRLLPGYQPVPGVAVDVAAADGGRRHFGNMIFSRHPVCQVFRHLLPYPVDPGVNGMPRVALEAVIEAPFGGAARDHHPSRVLRQAETDRAGRGAARRSMPRAAGMPVLARSSIVRAARSRPGCGPQRRL